MYWILDLAKRFLGDAAPWVVGGIVLAMYLFSVWAAAKSPDLPEDIDIENPQALDTWPAVKAGLHFLLPIGMLIWCLMVEEMSPSLSAFWAIVMLIVLMVIAAAADRLLPRHATPQAWTSGLRTCCTASTTARAT